LDHRIATFLIMLPLVFASAPPASSSSACDEARAELRQALDASEGRVTRTVAEAIRVVVDACPEPAPPGIASAVEGPDTRAAQVRGPQLLAHECGFVGLAAFRDEGSRVSGSTMTLDETRSGEERAQADVTYEPATNLTTYEARGSEYGLVARSDGSGMVVSTGGTIILGGGMVILHGVAVPASWTAAKSGCAEVGGPLCWGEAAAHRYVPLDALRVLTVSVLGSADVCAAADA
jgi:hypothetical protein